MTIHRSLLAAVIAVVSIGIDTSGSTRAAERAATPAAAAVPTSDRDRVMAQIASVGRRGFLYEVTRDDGDDAPRAADDSHGPCDVARGDPDPVRGLCDDARREPERLRAERDPARRKRLFLYGTIHVGRLDSEPFNRPVLEALRASRRLALEADPSDDATTRQLALRFGQYAADDGLGRHVPAALLARVAAFGERHGLSRERVERLRPWLLANMVTARQTDGATLDADLGTELYLVGFARGAGLPIVEIEGLEAQLRLLAGSPDAVQAAQLDEALGDRSLDANDDGEALFEVWRSGDVAAAERIVDAMHGDAADTVVDRYVVETLIDARDRRMADAAERDYALPGNTFFAVGALHLFGERGLVCELQRRGYRVTDLQRSAAVR